MSDIVPVLVCYLGDRCAVVASDRNVRIFRSKGSILATLFAIFFLVLGGIDESHAQTQLDKSGRIWCASKKVLTLKKGKYQPAVAAKLVATNKKAIKAEQAKLKRASKKARPKILRVIADLRAVNTQIDACLNGQFEPPAVIYTPLALGQFHNCAIRSDGRVACWGYNNFGQLGNGSTTDSTSPVNVVGLSRYSIAVAAGQLHSCAVSSSGGVSCWGRNVLGELGNGGAASSGPAQVVGLTSGVKTVVSGLQHTCALTTSGGVKCWGKNSDGQLGNGSVSSSSAVPTDVVGLASGVSEIAAGNDHTCALLSSGGVVCWGYNATRQLGNGATTSSAVPVNVVGVTGAINVDAGAGHSCAALSGGGVMCWGTNGFGEVGTGDLIVPTVPVPAGAVTDQVIRLATGNFFTCGLLSGQSVKCWGFNSFGALGNGTFSSSLTPVSASGISGAQIVAAGEAHACAVLSDRSVSCWGYNSRGQLGNGNTVDQSVPSTVSGLTLAQ
jgi:alpha-tubulin suppressor-like RCC1 family protein